VGFRFAVWVGELPAVVADSWSPECAASRQKTYTPGRRILKRSFYAGSKATRNSNHHVKMLAAYALLDDARVSGVYYIDMDAYVLPSAIGALPDLFRRAHDDGAVDVLFENARDPRLFWHIKGDTRGPGAFPLKQIVSPSYHAGSTSATRPCRASSSASGSSGAAASRTSTASGTPSSGSRRARNASPTTTRSSRG